MRARAGTRARREEPVALTARQEEVLRLLERGLTNTEIAAALGISLDGAKFHVSEIIGKLGATTREEAVEAWRRRRGQRYRALFSLPLLKWGAVAATAGGVAVVAVVAVLALGGPGEASLVECENPDRESQLRFVTPSPAGESSVQWIGVQDFVRFGGITYHRQGSISVERLGDPYGRVTFAFDEREFSIGYVPRECEASGLALGTILYEVRGVDPRLQLATAEGWLYQAIEDAGNTAEPTPTPEPVLAACPEPLTTPGSGGGAITWARIVRFNGIVYVWAGELETPDALLGPPFGRVQFQFGDVVDDPLYSPRDCDAAWLPPGTMFYAIDGYNPSFRIATEDGQAYEAHTAEGIQTAGEITDLRGKVTAIEFWAYNVEQPRLVASLVDGQQVASLIEDYLSAPYDRRWLETELGPQTVVLAFVLQDGTITRRSYDPESGFVRPAIWLPESFNEAAREAIAAGME